MKKIIFIIIFSILFIRCEDIETVVDDVAEDVEKQVKIWISDIADYKNWCGPWNDIKGDPADSLDTCCMAHDQRWQDVKEDKDYLVCGEGARADLDAELVECLENLGDNTENWDIPPEDADAAILYKDAAIIIFDICDSD